MNPEPQTPPITPPVSSYTPPVQQYTPPTPPPYIPRNAYPAPKKSHKGLFAFLFILLILILGAGYAAYVWVLHPENTVKDIISNIQSAPIISTNTKINIVAKDRLTYNVSLSVDVDKSTKNSLKAQALFDVDSSEFSAGLEARYLNETAYAQITSYPKGYDAILKNIANKWYSLAIKGVKEINTTGLYEKILASGTFTGIHFKGVALDGTNIVRNYTIDINPEIFNKNNTAKYGTSLSASSIPYADIAGSYARNLPESAQVSPLAISVDMFSGALRQMSLSITDTKSSAKINIITKYDGSKSETSIEAPDGAQSIQSLLNGFMSSTQDSIATARARGADARIKADVSNMRVISELYFDKGNTYVGNCTSPDAKAVVDDIKSNQSLLKCSATKTAYVLYAILPSSTSTPIYFCADSTGIVKELSKAPTGIVCK